MGQRTKNRILEHTRPGHQLNPSETTHSGIEVTSDSTHGKSFWICKCGWEGWLTNQINDPE